MTTQQSPPRAEIADDKEVERLTFAVCRHLMKSGTACSCERAGRVNMETYNWCHTRKETVQVVLANARLSRQDEGHDNASTVATDAKIGEATMQEGITGHHWRNGWYFRRRPDGTVTILPGEFNGGIDIPPSEWASIVASVSPSGDVATAHRDALAFHEKTVPHDNASTVAQGERDDFAWLSPATAFKPPGREQSMTKPTVEELERLLRDDTLPTPPFSEPAAVFDNIADALAHAEGREQSTAGEGCGPKGKDAERLASWLDEWVARFNPTIVVWRNLTNAAKLMRSCVGLRRERDDLRARLASVERERDEARAEVEALAETGYKNAVLADVAHAQVQALTEKLERANAANDTWRSCFEEITAKATPYGSGPSDDPERITSYIIPAGPLHRAAGKTGCQSFGFTEALQQYYRDMIENVIPQIITSERERTELAAHLRRGLLASLSERPQGDGTRRDNARLALNALRSDGASQCRAAQDGDCDWPECPQIRDGEPEKSRRHCPLDRPAPDSDTRKEK
jgi:hypothetical protein